MLQDSPIILLTVLIQYRLPRRVLEQKCAGIWTLSIILVVNVLASWLNLAASLTTELGMNTLYYGAINLALYMLLFRGSLIKKLFLSVLISCGLPLPYYSLLPFVLYVFEPGTQGLLIALQVLGLVNVALSFVGMEYMGKKFQNLRRELPVGYTIYLTGVIIFVYVAVYSAYGYTNMIHRFSVSLPGAFAMAVFALGAIALVMVAIFAVDRQVQVSLTEQLRAMQMENLKGREIEWRRFLGFRHDIKNHLICLSGLLDHGKTQQAADYMRNLTDTVQQFDSPVQTGNDYADALLSVKYAQAMAAGIRVSIDLALPAQGFADPVDLCCILSNGFDNAITACGAIPAGERWITARGFVRQGQLVLTIKNSKPPYVTIVDGQVFPKKITADHGLGLDTVKAVVQKYGGVVQLSAQEDFSFSVLLPQGRL